MWSRRRLCSTTAGASTNFFVKLLLLPSNHSGAWNHNNDCHHQVRKISTLRGEKVDEILEEIQSRDGLFKFTPHIEYLVGSNKQAFAGTSSSSASSGFLDISDKTQFVLQSAHPVRYVIEREIRALHNQQCLELKYLDWVTIFGRSLIPKFWRDNLSAKDICLHEDKLGKVGTATECGMFSADVHQTVINIPANFPPGKLQAEFNLGNKYAVLVGDYFAIKTIFFAEKVKSSPVFLGIIRGVEDYTYCSFTSNSNLLDSAVGYPILLPDQYASREDWINYSAKFMGYFTGGLNAAFILNSLRRNDPVLTTTTTTMTCGGEEDRQNLRSFIANLALVLKLVVELKDFEVSTNEDNDNNVAEEAGSSASSFISLPSVIYQETERGIFADFRNSRGYDKFDSNLAQEVRKKIAKSSAIAESKRMLQKFATDAQKSFNSLGAGGKDEYYSRVLNQLLQIAANY